MSNRKDLLPPPLRERDEKLMRDTQRKAAISLGLYLLISTAGIVKIIYDIRKIQKED